MSSEENKSWSNVPTENEWITPERFEECRRILQNIADGKVQVRCIPLDEYGNELIRSPHEEWKA